MYVLSDISFRAGNRNLLDDVSVGFERGTFTAIIGPNGAGKSTLLKILGGGLRPSSGAVTLDGTNIRDLKPLALAATRAVLTQSNAVSFAYTVRQVVEMALSRQVDGSPDVLVAEALSDTGLLAMRERVCATLSGGEQQRVHLARVLVQLRAAKNRPGYLLLDEPTNGLDLSYQSLVLELARRHVSDGGGAVTVLHDLNLASCYTSRIVAVKDGRIHADGTPAEVVTDQILLDLYDVKLSVNATPSHVFVLPGT